MPHVIVKLWPGKSEEQKKKLGGGNHQERQGHSSLWRRVSVGGDGRNQTAGVGGKGVRTRDQE
jgi:hypothetical protein